LNAYFRNVRDSTARYTKEKYDQYRPWSRGFNRALWNDWFEWIRTKYYSLINSNSHEIYRCIAIVKKTGKHSIRWTVFTNKPRIMIMFTCVLWLLLSILTKVVIMESMRRTSTGMHERKSSSTNKHSWLVYCRHLWPYHLLLAYVSKHSNIIVTARILLEINVCIDQEAEKYYIY
jgi:hypothetical protein